MYLCCTIGSCRFVNNGRIGSNHSTSSADMNNCPSGFGKVPFLRVAAEEEAENENENQLCCLSCLSITCLIFRILCVERTNERTNGVWPAVAALYLSYLYAAMYYRIPKHIQPLIIKKCCYGSYPYWTQSIHCYFAYKLTNFVCLQT